MLVSTTEGIGRLEDGEVALLALPHPDLGALLGDRQSLAPAVAGAVRRRLPLGAVRLLAPVPRPGKIWAVGLNYRDHAEETGMEAPAEPLVFFKATSSVLAPGEPVRLPTPFPHRCDYEGEVAVVIGRRASSVAEGSAWDYVAGVTAGNDVTARDEQRRTGNFGLAKSFDTFTPLGACLTATDAYADPDDIGLETVVNGELRQSARTTDLCFGVPELVAYLSRYTTLEPGDVISTGTPSGVGYPDGRYLRPGDVVEVRVEGVADLVNPVA